jgi:hypothetical protein
MFPAPAKPAEQFERSLTESAKSSQSLKLSVSRSVSEADNRPDASYLAPEGSDSDSDEDGSGPLHLPARSAAATIQLGQRAKARLSHTHVTRRQSVQQGIRVLKELKKEHTEGEGKDNSDSNCSADGSYRPTSKVHELNRALAVEASTSSGDDVELSDESDSDLSTQDALTKTAAVAAMVKKSAPPPGDDLESLSSEDSYTAFSHASSNGVRDRHGTVMPQGAVAPIIQPLARERAESEAKLSLDSFTIDSAPVQPLSARIMAPTASSGLHVTEQHSPRSHSDSFDSISSMSSGASQV